MYLRGKEDAMTLGSQMQVARAIRASSGVQAKPERTCQFFKKVSAYELNIQRNVCLHVKKNHAIPVCCKRRSQT